MTTPNPFPRRELPDQRRREMRSFLIAEVMRDGRGEPRRRPAFAAATAAAAVGTLAVGGVLVAPHLRSHPVAGPVAGAASSATAPPTTATPPNPPATVTPAPPETRTGTGPTPRGATTGCDGMVLADSPAVDDIRYLPRRVPTGYSLGHSWSTVLGGGCAAGSLTPTQLFLRPAAGGRSAGVIAMSPINNYFGGAATAAPSPSAPLVGTDGIMVAAGGRGHFIAELDTVQLETAGLSLDETLALARVLKSHDGKLSAAATQLLDGWTSVTTAPSGAETADWYAEAHLNTNPDGNELNYQLRRRTADDDVAAAFWKAAGIATVDLGGHPAFVLANGTSPVQFIAVEMTPTVMMTLEVPSAGAVQTARNLVSSLEKVTADDPRIVRPNFDSPSPSPTPTR